VFTNTKAKALKSYQKWKISIEWSIYQMVLEDL
jgi:hypothetical protein